MNIKSHYEHGRLAFEGLIIKFDSWAEKNIMGFLGYPLVAVRKRLSQKIVQIGLYPFLKLAIHRHERGDETFPSADTMAIVAGLKINTSVGAVSPTFKLFLTSVVRFFYRWVSILYQYCVAFMSSGSQRNDHRKTLVYGLITDMTHGNGNDARFIDFCRHGPIAPFVNAEQIFIQNIYTPKSIEPKIISYVKYPLISSACSSHQTFHDCLYFFVVHAYACLTYFLAAVRSPIMCILEEDFAFHAVATVLNKKSLIQNVVLTNAADMKQLLWMTDLPNRHFQCHMVWFSQNHQGLYYKEEPQMPHFTQLWKIRVDEGWVWTESQSYSVREHGVVGRLHIVGPILFYLPIRNKDVNHSLHAAKIRIGVFNISPVTNERGRELGYLYNYYSTENVISFIDGVLIASKRLSDKRGRDVEVIDKPKRRPVLDLKNGKSHHDRKFFDYLENLKINHPQYHQVPYDVNLFDFISSCHVVVVNPYSSPAFVARAVGVPSIFYDPTGELVPIYEIDPLVNFASGLDELTNILERLIPR